MGCRRDVDAVGEAGLVDVRETLAHEGGGLVRDVEVHAFLAGLFHLRVDGAGHDVARGERGERMVFVHERLALRRLEDAPLPAHGLGDEERARLRVEEARRMELHELHVRNRRPRPPRHRDAVARGDVGVGGVEVHLAAPAGGEDRAQRAEGFHLAGVLVEHVRAEAAVFRGEAELGAGDEVHGHVAFEHGDVRLFGDGAQQGALDLAAGGVVGMEHAAAGMTALAGEVEFVPGAVAVGVLAFVEVDARGR